MVRRDKYRTPYRGFSLDVERFGKPWESMNPIVIGHVATLEAAYRRVALLRELSTELT